MNFYNKYCLQGVKLIGIVFMVSSYNFYNQGNNLISIIFMIGSVILYVLIPSLKFGVVKEE